MTMSRQYGASAGVLSIMAASLVLTGCIGGPTYGTDKTAGEHLMDDLGSAVSMGSDKAASVKYQPRPGLVLPPSGERTALVQPQASLANKDNPAWVESPEETRQRLREEADENSDRPGYVSPLAKASANGRKLTAQEQQDAYREARKVQMGAYSDKRRFLSDPPLDYRRAPEASLTDLGEEESVKERRRKKEAQVQGSGKKWWQIF
ncbi:hypothetical protein ASG25_04435 [Rhizobium sp. Leaf384]|uniref:hypothetical protein n=1 Tax=unclassified Rhizobium TaxID=2613769 RepID=UPI0007148B80|nr:MULTISPECIES: hypothetical protein [unclassified Rhizobium]KQR77506.1 hypothetical protein ASG03_13890 [Rhizobium sp. Leaf341]KQS77287.1 hypothetical protein ASG58_09815 [Rhizobium sp. Leaf383]KQS80790.1 hypothetical protein ASG25_04435 [Rhizobium sp. Leaf384]